MNVITITGTCHYYGQEFLKPGMKIQLIKDPENKYDREAIRAEVKGIGKIGYVANSPQTVLGESMSAGRLYDKIGDKAKATVLYVLPCGVLCRVKTALHDDIPIPEEDVPTETDEDEYDKHIKTLKEDTIDGSEKD